MFCGERIIGQANQFGDIWACHYYKDTGMGSDNISFCSTKEEAIEWFHMQVAAFLRDFLEPNNE